MRTDTPKECPLCHGTRSKTFVLAPRQSLSRYPYTKEATQSQRIEQRTYPCPECSTPQNKVGIAMATVRVDLNTTDHEKHAAVLAIEQLQAFILEQGLVTITRLADDTCRATIAVVTEDHKAMTDKFCANVASSAITEMMRKTLRNIRIWGMNHEGAHGRIAKDDCVRIIVDAANAIDPTAHHKET